MLFNIYFLYRRVIIRWHFGAVRSRVPPTHLLNHLKIRNSVLYWLQIICWTVLYHISMAIRRTCCYYGQKSLCGMKFYCMTSTSKLVAMFICDLVCDPVCKLCLFVTSYVTQFANTWFNGACQNFHYKAIIKLSAKKLFYLTHFIKNLLRCVNRAITWLW